MLRDKLEFGLELLDANALFYYILEFFAEMIEKNLFLK